jgi:adenylate kinase
MNQEVILITGTPGVGKTSVAIKLAQQLNATYVNLTELAKKKQLIAGKDVERGTEIIDETKMSRALKRLITQTESNLVVDGHYAAAVTPQALVTYVFVLRRHPAELQRVLEERGYSRPKQNENLTAEVLDVCLVEALNSQDKAKVCELDTSGKTMEETLSEVLAVVEGKKRCYAGYIDWMSILEREGKLDQYLSPT